MKNYTIVILFAALFIWMFFAPAPPRTVLAQTAPVFAAPSWGSNGPIATAPSQCGPPVAAHAAALCPVETTVGNGVLYQSINGSPWTLVGGVGGVAGVQTFNGRKPDATGNIAPALNDYNYGQIQGTIPPSAFSTSPVFTVNGHPGPTVTLLPSTAVTATTTIP